MRPSYVRCSPPRAPGYACGDCVRRAVVPSPGRFERGHTGGRGPGPAVLLIEHRLKQRVPREVVIGRDAVHDPERLCGGREIRHWQQRESLAKPRPREVSDDDPDEDAAGANQDQNADLHDSPISCRETASLPTVTTVSSASV